MLDVNFFFFFAQMGMYSEMWRKAEKANVYVFFWTFCFQKVHPALLLDLVIYIQYDSVEGLEGKFKLNPMDCSAEISCNVQNNNQLHNKFFTQYFHIIWCPKYKFLIYLYKIRRLPLQNAYATRFD